MAAGSVAAGSVAAASATAGSVAGWAAGWEALEVDSAATGSAAWAVAAQGR